MLRFFYEANELKKINPSLNSIIEKHFKEYFSEIPRLKKFSHTSKNAIKIDLKGKVIEILRSDNSLLELRKNISDYVIQLSYFTVLSITEEDKNESFRGNPYISADLYKYLIQLLPNEDKLEELRINYSITNEEIHEYCRTRKVLFLFYVNGLNFVRSVLGDIAKNGDWLTPFLEAMCVWQENIIRKYSNLPVLIESDIKILAYSSFMNIVESGNKDPLKKWKHETKYLID
jgi:hypothetical protein